MLKSLQTLSIKVVQKSISAAEYLYSRWRAKVFDGRVYLYGSKDEFDGEYCCHKFHVYSAPVSDLTEWTDHGPVLASTDEYEK